MCVSYILLTSISAGLRCRTPVNDGSAGNCRKISTNAVQGKFDVPKFAVFPGSNFGCGAIWLRLYRAGTHP